MNGDRGYGGRGFGGRGGRGMVRSPTPSSHETRRSMLPPVVSVPSLVPVEGLAGVPRPRVMCACPECRPTASQLAPPP